MWKRLILLLALLGTAISCRVLQDRVPPPLEAKDCSLPKSKDELPIDRFTRKGGRETTAKVKYEHGMLTVDGIEQQRDLSRYERLDLPEPENVSGLAELEEREARVRMFIWEHWKERKQGYLTYTGSSVDATSTSHIFVEQDKTGRWRVASRIVRHSNEIDDSPTYYGVEWVLPGGWREPGTPLKSGEQPDPKKHELEFRDKCGDVEHSF